MAKTIWTTNTDRERLLACLDGFGPTPGHRERPHLQELARELARAQVYGASDGVPPDLVTMRSRVRLRNLSTGGEIQCVLVYPEESDPEQNSISVLAPLGTALLGHRTGDAFEVPLPKGATTYRIDAILYQPEAAGDFHL